MDPDETLRELRNLAGHRGYVGELLASDANDRAGRACDLFRELDKYLTAGGQLPTAWCEP